MAKWESDDTENEIKLHEYGINWLPIIMILTVIVLLLIIGLVILFLRKRRASGYYNPAATNEPGATITIRS
ncbi:unnamed protein product [Rotaria sp. Silwood1]|nr:unnamed protein product [Rotaria sp. Silwood1]CAF1428346.1 unnamed protein product [Rotaria sp. Silwood1]